MSFELRFWKVSWSRITLYSNSKSIECPELTCLPVVTTGDFVDWLGYDYHSNIHFFPCHKEDRDLSGGGVL